MKNLQNILKYKFIKSCMLYFCQCLLKSITLDIDIFLEVLFFNVDESRWFLKSI